MTSKNFAWALLPFIMLTGCVESHRTPVVYYTPVPNTAVSSRPVERVYPDTYATQPPVAVVAPSVTTAGPTDLDLAEAIRQSFVDDPVLGREASDVQVAVKSGRVTLEGAVPTREDSEHLAHKIAAIPGVDSVKNHLRVQINH